jgi:hypothetical protein
VARTVDPVQTVRNAQRFVMTTIGHMWRTELADPGHGAQVGG